MTGPIERLTTEALRLEKQLLETVRQCGESERETDEDEILCAADAYAHTWRLMTEAKQKVAK